MRHGILAKSVARGGPVSIKTKRKKTGGGRRVTYEFSISRWAVRNGKRSDRLHGSEKKEKGIENKIRVLVERSKIRKKKQAEWITPHHSCKEKSHVWFGDQMWYPLQEWEEGGKQMKWEDRP